MKERPILFSGAMVRAILSGQKTQTRRIVKMRPDAQNVRPCSDYLKCDALPGSRAVSDRIRCPHGESGDRLWVREAFMHEPAEYEWMVSTSRPIVPARTTYRADFTDGAPSAGWTPSIHMPRALSRIDLEVTGVRVERLQDISEADILAEGVTVPLAAQVTGIPWSSIPTLHDAWRYLWEHINGVGSWDLNPWVWVVSFKRIEAAAKAA